MDDIFSSVIGNIIYGFLTKYGIPIPKWFYRIFNKKGNDSPSLSSNSLCLEKRLRNTTFKKHLSCANQIYILNTFAPNFDARLKEDILVPALRERICVKILLLNPLCEEVHDRQLTLQKWDGEIEDAIKRNINFLHDIYHEAQEQKINSESLLHLKLYNSWAPFSLYATDRGASIGFFMHGTLAVEGPQLVITKDEYCFDKFIDQFEKIWETGKLFKLSEKYWQGVLDGFR